MWKKKNMHGFEIKKGGKYEKPKTKNGVISNSCNDGYY